MRVCLIVTAVLIVIATPAVVFAQSGDGDTIPSFDGWLAGVSGPILGTFIAAALSWVAEFFPWYEALHPKLKVLAYLGFCVLASVSAACLRGGLGYVPWSFDPLIWHALWAAFAQFGAGSLVHEFIPIRKK